jgi:hypothetical protein
MDGAKLPALSILPDRPHVLSGLHAVGAFRLPQGLPGVWSRGAAFFF